MLSTRTLTVLATALCASLASAIPAPQAGGAPSASTGYWYADIDHSKDTVWEISEASGNNYTIFRNVKTLGAKGNGIDDDTTIINQIIAEGGRCGGEPVSDVCDSATNSPAIIYFPPGTYMVSKPIQMFYYTHMIGNPNDLPIIKATANFEGMAVLDADPYLEGGANWFTNQNNFFRQVRNFVIDIREQAGGMSGAGIHWQVAQATSLQNIVFEQSTAPGNAQQGIFMDNGSGGFMTDLTFNGGKIGAFLGSQQFTTRNLTFNNCGTAIFMNWNWGWTLHGITINGGHIGLDMANAPENQTVGSVVISDSTITGADYGVRFAYKNSSENMYPTGGTLVLDNVDMSGVGTAAVVDNNNVTVVEPGLIKAWASGMGYTAKRNPTNTVVKGVRQENDIRGARKAPSLLDPDGNIFSRSRPQYEDLPLSSFVSAKTEGCAGDGQTDDTAAINALLKKVANTQNVAYFEHGAYLVKDTIIVPPNVKMTGQIWPLIVADGASFSNEQQPKPVFQVGKRGGERGFLEISDFMFETNGPAPGAIMIEWNLQSQQGASGMWDTHVRIGGSVGTNLQSPECAAVNGTGYQINEECKGVFLMFHATKPASGIYLENTWFWVADHNLDVQQPTRVTIYSARGMLIQSQGPMWMWGSASEHSILYNYQLDGAKAVFSGLMQSETPYMQPYPLAPEPFVANKAYRDPFFTLCDDNDSPYCKEAWGMRIMDSKQILIYSTGLYSFFQNYTQECVETRDCQQNMIHLMNSQVDMYAVNTFSAVNMIVDDDYGTVKNEDNLNWFCATIAYYFTH